MYCYRVLVQIVYCVASSTGLQVRLTNNAWHTTARCGLGSFMFLLFKQSADPGCVIAMVMTPAGRGWLRLEHAPLDCAPETSLSLADILGMDGTAGAGKNSTSSQY